MTEAPGGRCGTLTPQYPHNPVAASIGGSRAARVCCLPGAAADTAAAALSREVALSRGTHACGMWQTRAGRWDNQRRLGRIGLFVVAPLAGRRTTYLRPGLAMPRPRAASGVQLCSARWTVAIDRPAAVGIGGSIKLGSNTVVLLLRRYLEIFPVLRPSFARLSNS